MKHANLSEGAIKTLKMINKKVSGDACDRVPLNHLVNVCISYTYGLILEDESELEYLREMLNSSDKGSKRNTNKTN